ncbi:MAG: DUF5658 family protein [Nitrospiraceae bacterium]|nr:DUF5658 family protein [Nitrospiraceae bacterium]
MPATKRNLLLHLSISILLYIIFASFDILLTLKGIDGDIHMEGNPVLRHMMTSFGITAGLILGKGIVLSLAALTAVVCYIGIHRDSDWVYYLALTRMTKNWLKRKKRYWIAFLPLYLIAFSQAVAAGMWVHLLAG